MPLISLTQETIDRGKVPEIGWSPVSLHSVTEFKAAKGDSTNYVFEFVCDSGPEKKETNKGRFCNILFNSKALGIGDGARGVPDAIQKFTLMIAALQGIHVKEVTPDDYDTDKLIGHTCWVKIDNVTDMSGKPAIAITDFTALNDVPF